MKWLKLTDDGRHALVAFRTQNGQGLIGLAIPESDRADLPRIMSVLAQDGFELIDGIPVRSGAKFSTSLLKSLYPNMKVVDVEQKDLTIKHVDHKWMLPLVHKAREIGLNRSGDTVFEGFGGVRFVSDGNASEIADVLIWDGSDDGLAACAEGFVMRLVRKANPASFKELQAFGEIINTQGHVDIETLMRQLQEAVESALNRYQQSLSVSAEGFEISRLLYSRQPSFEARTSSSVKLQQFSTPLPLSIVVQNILGDLGGQVVCEPTVGNGSLLSMLPASVRGVVACDLDESRLKNTQRLLSAIPSDRLFLQKADATKNDFSLNLGKVDCVVGNPPFGALDKPVNRYGVKVGRLDHEIVLNSLAARKPDGLAVFVVGADSYIEAKAGEVTGSSRWLFNHLADHYEFDAVEVPGKVVYSRQGASYPIRLIVIGDKLAAPIERQINEIPVISNLDDLWGWSQKMRAKYGLVDESKPAPLFDEIRPLRYAGTTVRYSEPKFGILTGVIEETTKDTVSVLPLLQSKHEQIKEIADRYDLDVNWAFGPSTLVLQGKQQDWLPLLSELQEIAPVLLGKSGAGRLTFEPMPQEVSWPQIESVLTVHDELLHSLSDEVGSESATPAVGDDVDDGLTLGGVQFSAKYVNGTWLLVNDSVGVDLVSSRTLGAQNTRAAVYSAIQELYAAIGDDAVFSRITSSPIELQRQGMSAVVVTELADIEVPDGWIVCNATRPLVGDRVIEDGVYNSGRFYALINPSEMTAASYLVANANLDAKVVLTVPKAQQIEMALYDNEYADKYRAEFTDEDELYRALNPKQYLVGKTVREIEVLQQSTAAPKEPVVELVDDEAELDAVVYRMQRRSAIAKEIIAQLGDGFSRVTGAKNFVTIDNGVQFSLPGKPGFVRDGINRIKIELSEMDLYTVTGLRFTTRSGVTKCVEKSRKEGIYNDQLIAVLEEMTGLACIMPRIVRDPGVFEVSIPSASSSLIQPPCGSEWAAKIDAMNFEQRQELVLAAKLDVKKLVSAAGLHYTGFSEDFSPALKQAEPDVLDKAWGLCEQARGIAERSVSLSRLKNPLSRIRAEELAVMSSEGHTMDATNEFKNWSVNMTLAERSALIDFIRLRHIELCLAKGYIVDGCTAMVYPWPRQRDGAIEHLWAAQALQNVGTNKVMGDTVHTTEQQAVEQVRRNHANHFTNEPSQLADAVVASQAVSGATVNDEEDRMAELPISERRSKAFLAKPARFSDRLVADGWRGDTRAEAIENGVNAGLVFEAAQVTDNAANRRDEGMIESARKHGYLLARLPGIDDALRSQTYVKDEVSESDVAALHSKLLEGQERLSNPNIPAVAAALEAMARLAAGGNKKAEYRLYAKDGETFNKVTKTEFEYASQIKGRSAQQEVDRLEAQPAQSDGDGGVTSGLRRDDVEALQGQLLAGLKRTTQDDIEKAKRLSKADLEMSGCGQWRMVQLDGRPVRATESLYLLSDRYPEEIEALLAHKRLPMDVTIGDAPLIEESMQLREGYRMTIQATTSTLPGGNDLVAMTSEMGVYLVPEPLVRVALKANPHAQFVLKATGIIEAQDLNGDPVAYIQPRSTPSRVEFPDFYEALDEQIRNLPLLVDKPEPANSKKSVIKNNEYQTTYVAGSKLGLSTAMIPVNLSTPTQQALARVASDRGDIDQFVADELHWTLDELSRFLSPEQIDAMALAIYAFEHDRGLLEGDQTGLGKGRVMAATARYAALNDKPVFFLTETPTLFSDLWRDLKDIESDHMFKPFILNDGVAIFDVINGSKIYSPTSVAERKQALDTGKIPDGCNIVLSTYSQFNRSVAKSKKTQWLFSATEGCALLMDESHNAAGESNTGTNLKRAVDAADFVIYSSATSMKDSKNVLIYSKLFPESVDLAALPETLAAGGEVLQEVLSGMLAADGVFIRREHDLSNLTMKTVVDVTREARNRDLSDKLASILELMNYLAGDINELVSKRNREIEELLERIPAHEREGNRMGAQSVNFGSRLFNLYRQFLMTIKIDAAVELSKAGIAAGEKPVIILENTMESLLKDTLFDQVFNDELDDGELTTAADASVGKSVEISGLTFRDVLYRTLDRISSYQETDRYGQVSRKSVTSEESLELIANIRSEINEFPELPVSPIDELVHRMGNDNIFCDELSGRKMKVIEREGRFFAEAIIERPKATIVNDYNSGRSDAIVLSRAGSTGISLHSSEKFIDQRKRLMLELQSAADVNKRVQFFGRVNRKGQVNDPTIVTISSGLIGEARPIAMQNAKLRKLSANTTSNQDNAALDDEIPDFLNSVGNRIALRYLEANPSIASRLDIDIDGDSQDENYYINKLTSRIMMLKVAEQEMIYDELTTDFNREIARLDALGQNPLRSRVMDVKAREVSCDIETTGNPYSNSVFDQNIYIREMEYVVLLNPLRSEQVKEMVEAGLARLRNEELNRGMMPAAEFLQGLVSYLAAHQMQMLKAALPKKKGATVEDALASPEPNACQKTRDRIRFLLSNLMELLPGRAIRLSNDKEEMVQGLIVKLELPEKQSQLDMLGKYSLSIVTPGATGTITRSLYMLMTDPNFGLLPGFAADSIYRAIDAAPQGERLERLTILDGNIFGAAQRVAEAKVGRSVIYTDESGVRRRAMALFNGITKEDLQNLPVRIPSADVAVAALDEGIVLYNTQSSGKEERAASLSVRVSGHELVLSVPGTARGGSIYKDEELTAVTGEFKGNRTSMTAKTPVRAAGEAMRILFAKGISFYVDCDYKDRIDELKMTVYANKSCDNQRAGIKIG